MNTTAKVDFAGAAWIDAAREVLEDLIATHGTPDLKFSVCEVFSGAPAHVAPSGTAAWYFYVDGDSVEVGPGERNDVDLRMGGDYEAALPGARTVYTPEYLAQREAEREAEREKQPPDPDAPQPDIQGDPSILPPWIVELHNRLAPITA